MAREFGDHKNELAYSYLDIWWRPVNIFGNLHVLVLIPKLLTALR